MGLGIGKLEFPIEEIEGFAEAKCTEIFTTVGLYNNQEYKTNGVTKTHLAIHIHYNIIHRFGRALFINGRCIYKGYLNKDVIAHFEGKFKDIKLTKDTQPYH